jgi:hypothetical protein
VTRDVQVAGHADRHRLQVGIEHVHLRVRDRTADRHRAARRVASSELERHRSDDRLGRPVFVHDPAGRLLMPPSLHRLAEERFAAHDQGIDDASPAREDRIAQQLVERDQMRWRDLEESERFLAAQELTDGFDRPAGLGDLDDAA